MSAPPLIFSLRWWRLVWLILRERFGRNWSRPCRPASRSGQAKARSPTKPAGRERGTSGARTTLGRMRALADEPRLIGARETAALLGASEDTVRRAVQDGRLPAVRLRELGGSVPDPGRPDERGMVMTSTAYRRGGRFYGVTIGQPEIRPGYRGGVGDDAGSWSRRGSPPTASTSPVCCSIG
jgi:excisionase family DNA binding protein